MLFTDLNLHVTDETITTNPNEFVKLTFYVLSLRKRKVLLYLVETHFGQLYTEYVNPSSLSTGYLPNLS